MAHLRYVTLTGAGEKTSFTHMNALSEQFPLAEWGVLYSPDRAGRENRYPSLAWLQRFAKRAQRASMCIALHLCGRAVDTVLEAAALPRDQRTPEAVQLLSLMEQFDRVQLNRRASPEDVERYGMLAREVGRSEFRTRLIVQYYPSNAEFVKLIAREEAFDVLIDGSGGRGIVCEEWPQLNSFSFPRLGYAGGLDRRRIVPALHGAVEVNGGRPFWVDMEGRLRDENDQFDLEHCWAVLNQASAWVLEQRKEQASLHPKGRISVNRLSDMWLDWWLARALGVRFMTIPPLNASAATYLWRERGTFLYFDSRSERQAIEAQLAQHAIALAPQVTGGWAALRDGKELVRGPDLSTTCQRAVVALAFGKTVPRQPPAD